MTMTPRIFLFAALAGLLPAAAFAQSCAAPIELPAATTTLTGNTCTGSVELPNLIDGAILNENQQHVYHVKLTGPNVGVQVQSTASADMSMFVCPTQCSTTAP